MMFRPAIISPCFTAENCFLVDAMFWKFEPLRKAGNLYRICSEVFAAGFMSPKLVATASDCGIARKFDEEGVVVATKLNCV